MNWLPEDIQNIIYKNVHTLDVLPELEHRLEILRIEQCVKKSPYTKSLSFIAMNSNVRLNNTLHILNSNSKIYKIFNNLYNTTFYYHLDNSWLI